MSDEQNRDDIKQAHDYARHVFQIFLSWFTVFATINYAAMGWMGGLAVKGRPVGSAVALVVPAMFIVQNVFALFAAKEVWRALAQQATEVAKLGGSAAVMPRQLYSRSVWLIGFALFTTIIAWAAVAFVLSHPMR